MDFSQSKVRYHGFGSSTRNLISQTENPSIDKPTFGKLEYRDTTNNSYPDEGTAVTLSITRRKFWQVLAAVVVIFVLWTAFLVACFASMMKMENTVRVIEDTLIKEGFFPTPIANYDGYPKSCEDVVTEDAKAWDGKGGVFNISLESGSKVEVYCEMEGRWTVFQRRLDGSVNFNRTWDEYVDGFGDKNKEMWLGLETIHQLTKKGNYLLRVDLADWEGKSAFAEYSGFRVGGSEDNYVLTVRQYSGTAGNSLGGHSGKQFSTPDRDNDPHGVWHCARGYKSGWWFNQCHESHLNGVYYKGGVYKSRLPNGIAWQAWKGAFYSLKSTEMKFRRMAVRKNKS